MATDGSITFSTKLDNSELEKDIANTEKKIKELEKALEQSESDRNVIVEKLEAADKAIKETERNIEQLKATAASAEEIDAQKAILNEQLDAAVEIAEQYYKADANVALLTKELDAARGKQKQLGAEYASSYTKAASNFNTGMTSMNARFDAFMGKITKRIKKLFVFSFIFGALASLKSYLMSAVQENERFQAATANLKAVLAGLATPILNVVIPALTAVVNVISVMLTTLARLVDMVFKTDFVQQIQAAQNAAMTSQQAADATDDETKATKKLTKAKKEAVRWLAAFDELNVMQKQNDNESDAPLDPVGNAGAGGVGGGVGAFDIGKIDESLAEIMLILGAALMAVGAILAFSGINIPLGITLMAIGALMVYTAAVEQWDKLPQELRDTINMALIITGIVLIVLGAVLAFSGIATPLGIGMIAAGALMLWTAVALNWDSMSAEMQGTVSALMVILGAALLVIGAILTFSGAGTPLGIGLMLLGAASLAAVAAINWKTMPDEIRRTVTEIMVILGAALLVIGAILALSGVGVTLGVGLMLVGAASLAAAAALNWETMPQQVRDTVSTIMAIIGGALIVIGIILCVTGVGIPLGVALILAGAASLVAAAAINWNFLQDKIKDIWNGIVQWFNTTVAPIFTAEWWENKFKSIVNGLISMLNSGLNAFGGFLNDLGGGISDILNFFGVTGYSFSIGMPQIPYLAQGAVIPPNREFMAVLGDQSNGTNLEAPENLIRQIVREESGVGSGEIVNLLNQMLVALQARQTLECDGYTLAKVVNQRNQTNTRIYGY